MLKKQRYQIREIKEFPTGATLIIDNQFAKIKDNELHLFNITSGWINTYKTLEEYNDYYVYEHHEFNLYQIIKHYYRTLTDHYGHDKNFWFYYDPSSSEYKMSYNKPVKKGFVLEAETRKKLDRYKSGEFYIVSKFPQLIKLINDNGGVIDLFTLEYKIRCKFEQLYLMQGIPIPRFDQNVSRYYPAITERGVNLNDALELFTVAELNEMMGVETSE